MLVAIAVTMLALAAMVAFVRVIRGPTLPDRVISIDLVGVVIVTLMIVAGAATGEAAFLDVAMIVALVSFVGTVAYARYIERERRP